MWNLQNSLLYKEVQRTEVVILRRPAPDFNVHVTANFRKLQAITAKLFLMVSRNNCLAVYIKVVIYWLFLCAEVHMSATFVKHYQL